MTKKNNGLGKRKKFLSIFAIVGISLMICIGLIGTVSALSTVPKSVSIDVTDGGLSLFKAEQIYVMSKQLDNALWDDGVGGPFMSNRYFVLQSGMFGKQYSGSSSYLYVTFYANGNTGTWPENIIHLAIDGESFVVYMPQITITKNYNWQLYSFYVAEDGSTYFARRDHAPSDALTINNAMAGSIDLSPSQAMVPEHLAKAAPTISATVDIKPGSYPNSFNNNGNGAIPVAVLGNVDFNVREINLDTVMLEGLAIKAVGKGNKLLAHYEDVNGDGDEDLVVQIEDSNTVFSEGCTTAKLFGNLNDGTPFEGTDGICIVP